MRNQVKWLLCLTLIFGSLQALFVQPTAASNEPDGDASTTAVAAASPLRPFPQHTTYVSGVIKPNNVDQAEMDNEVRRLYDEWKGRYLKKNPYVSNQYFVHYNLNQESDDDPQVVTTSEANGYGMLITAIMAGYDSNAQTYFDGLYRFYKAHPSEINAQLMAWQQKDNGSAIVSNEDAGVNGATDGDMDIAYGLLLADKQWGSSGSINYKSAAVQIINAIMASEVNQSAWHLKLGDWASDSSSKWGKGTRPSDYMLNHLRAFRAATGDGRWDTVLNQTYSIIQQLYTGYASSTGLLPDFATKESNGYKPAVGEYLETDKDGYYYYNASRTPWRIATDYILTGDSRAKAQLTQLNNWIKGKTGSDPAKIKAGYRLNGNQINSYYDLTFATPFAVSAMIDNSNQAWLNALWSNTTSKSTNSNTYFSNSIRLLSLITVSGNWWGL
ncbi:glycosyl hydrolase family 8 [Paenibacillus alvei]|uniref:glycosyl hydrolase family 8 n=1 Tax=Paenibacillus alvei TaxID=44250 RepID=UPI0018CD5295|nr:glycosyl hydrolase family 8 [Paenibacillus alvei]MBG9733866.1 beta-glucanase [Paenibacillus alvei]MBG9743815.1 beta-glucanase [Paenibacillus alvei]MCY9580279.1 glycosyl hydrolase family 8 [Paenibacillus alvei]MCY9583395.1 glycosyl hydrolase family 8 [Paenibacillus alvei]